ncbi:MAG TPA: hypothetical protein VHU40_07095 [Polyangia bacterium]|nr:hypothetical protein [Polyangia bacterium]
MTETAVASPFGAGLGSLFDLQGVYGSFLVTTSGDVVARALPEVVDDATLIEVAGRVIRLAETFETVGVAPELCVLRFADHKLYIKGLLAGVLCILTTSDVNLPALRMAANVVARRVGPELARARAAVADGATAPAPHKSPPAAGVAPAGPRMYRGRPIG